MSQIIVDHIHIPTTNSIRKLRIYMPKLRAHERAPVLYMHDGQNLFDDADAYGGVSWDIKNTLDELIENKVIKPIIVVGIDNSDQRVFEYSPYKASAFVQKKLYFDLGGKGDQYAQFCALTLKHYIDQHYPTKPEFEHTMMAGSSLGGLISAYVGMKYPNLYQHFGIFSLASWFNEEAFLDDLKQSSLHKNHHYFITIGRFETSDENEKNFPNIYIENSRNYKKALKQKGISKIYYQETDDTHHESNWKKAFPIFIKYVMKNR